MGKVVDIRDSKSSKPVVEYIEGLLRQAKKGEIEAIVSVSIDTEGECKSITVVTNDRFLELVGAIEFVKQDLMEVEE